MPNTLARPPAPPPPPVFPIWGVPLAAITYKEALDRVVALIERGEPSYFITANMHYAMLVERMPQLEEVTRGADFIVSDGGPFLRIAAWKGGRLPERIAGSDMTFDLCRVAAERGYKVFLLGGGPGVGVAAAENLRRRHPGLQVSGVASPVIGAPGEAWEEELAEQIHAAAPHLLLAGLGMPKGELVLARLHRQWGVPVSVQVGMSLDLAAGRIRRAPRWVQRMGWETLHRIALEPRRLLPRYSRNFLFLVRKLLADLPADLADRSARRRGRLERRRDGMGRP
jgi:N-acetylglucosaminyldiphosphoundecaprenol N-acetyl-beta-D-mannosaminyltransferase